MADWLTGTDRFVGATCGRGSRPILASVFRRPGDRHAVLGVVGGLDEHGLPRRFAAIDDVVAFAGLAAQEIADPQHVQLAVDVHVHLASDGQEVFFDVLVLVGVEVLARQQDIAAGRLHPFSGPIADNEGHARVGKGQKLDDAQILQMNWLVDGVRTPLPR